MKTIAVSIVALIAATPALAQTAQVQSGQDQTVFETSPTGETGSDAVDDTVVVTASRSGTGTEVRDLPASVTVLSAEQMEQRQTRLVSDILRDVPGVAVNRSIGGLTDVRIRGSEANHVLVLIDGIEVSDPYQGQYDFGTLIADDGARVEVLRGQQSSLYGSDAIGGVIQYITPTGAENQGLSARVEGGSFRTAAGAARFGGVSGNVDYALSGTLYRTDGTPTARDGSRDIGYTGIGASAKVNWTPSDVFKLTGVGRYSYTDALSNDSAFSGPRFGYIVDTPGTHFKNKAYYGLVRAALSLADGRWNTSLTGQVADTTRTGYSNFGIDYGDKGQRYKASLESSLAFGSDTFRSKLTGAVDYEREQFRNTVASPFSFSGRKTTENWGFVGQYEGTIAEALVVGASIRHDENDRFADVTTYRLQAGYRLPFGLRARGAYGTGVKNPGYFELFAFADGRYIGNPNLKPEKSKGWEAGLDQEFAGGKATVGATYFDSKLQDEIFTTFPAPSFVATPANRTTRSRQKGVEVFASARPIEQLRFDLAYTYLNARENGTVEVRRPKHIGSFNTTVFSMDKRFSSTLSVRYNGRQDDVAFTDPSFVPVRVSLQEYVLVNLNGEYRLSDRFSVFGRVENVFNERYEEVFSFATPGRGAYGGVKARF
jgi:vitamin B12 transporter